MKIIVHWSVPSVRLRVRKVHESCFIRDAVESGLAGKLRIGVNNGGSVANSYGYPAETEAIGCVSAFADGALVVFCVVQRLPANKVTLAGSAGATLGTLARRRYDNRTADAPTIRAIWEEAQDFAETDRTSFLELDSLDGFDAAWKKAVQETISAGRVRRRMQSCAA